MYSYGKVCGMSLNSLKDIPYSRNRPSVVENHDQAPMKSQNIIMYVTRTLISLAEGEKGLLVWTSWEVDSSGNIG